MHSKELLLEPNALDLRADTVVFIRAGYLGINFSV